MAVSTGPTYDKARYGPGLSLGYGYIARRGFSVLIGIGAGFATAIHKAELMANLGFGYTWRR